MRSVKVAVFCAMVLCLASCSKTQIRMSFDGFTNDTVVVMSVPVDMIATATDDSALAIDTLLITNNRIEIVARDEAMAYTFLFKETDDCSPNFSRRSINVMTMPKERISLDVKRTQEQFEYTARGSDYVEGLADYDSFVRPISHKMTKWTAAMKPTGAR